MPEQPHRPAPADLRRGGRYGQHVLPSHAADLDLQQYVHVIFAPEPLFPGWAHRPAEDPALVQQLLDQAPRTDAIGVDDWHRPLRADEVAKIWGEPMEGPDTRLTWLRRADEVCRAGGKPLFGPGGLLPEITLDQAAARGDRPMTTPSNPFSEPAPVTPDQPPSVLALVQHAMVTTGKARTAGPAKELMAALDSRGAAAWREAALLLVQYVLAWGEYPPGETGARQVEAERPADPRTPASNTMTAAIAAYLRGEDSAAFATLLQADEDAVRGAVRLLFVVAAGSGGQLGDAEIDVLLAEVCRGVL
jgi:hypothetical protein